MDKSLATLTKEEKIQVNKIRNKRRNITIDVTGIKTIIRNYYEKFYANKLDKPEWINSEKYKAYQD